MREKIRYLEPKSRVDVYMEHLKQVSNKEIYDIEDKDVLEFLIFKDVNDSGRTVWAVMPSFGYFISTRLCRPSSVWLKTSS